MVILWVIDVALTVLAWIVGLFGFTETLELPAALSLTVAVPMAGAGGVAVLNTWWPVAVGVATALAIGAALQWFYKLIPGKMT